MTIRFLLRLALCLLPVWNSASAEALADKTLPPPRSIKASARIGGEVLQYQVTVGALAAKDEDGRTIGEVVVTSYRLPGNGADRPITFALNGGPGMSSVFLNFGLMGPKALAFGGADNSPSGPVRLHDNPSSWLRFTDLVFIDPIGTGFSRASLAQAEAKQAFLTADGDVQYLSRAVHDWLAQNDRMGSPKYLVGESYGGYRVPRMAHLLQTRLGVGVSGLFMLSPYLDRPALNHDTQLSPLPWMISLVSMSADNMERQGVGPDEKNMAPIEAYARGAFVTDYLAGARDEAATDRLSRKVADLIGLDPAFVRQLNGRVDSHTYLREIGRSTKRVASAGDPAFFVFDSFPERAGPDDADPLIDSVLAPLTSAMVDFVVNEVGWRADGHYEVNNLEVNEAWEWDNTDTAVQDLRRAMAVDPEMSVTIAHGRSDLLCGYFGTRLTVDQMPEFGRAGRIRLLIYPGGHMFYTRAQSSAAFSRNASFIYRAGSGRPTSTAGVSR